MHQNEKPITCVKSGKDQCQEEPLFLGEDLLEVRAVEKEDMNMYTDLVSVKVVKVKADGQFFQQSAQP